MVIAAPPSATDVLGGNAGHCRQSGPRTTGLGDWSGFEPSCSCEHGGSDGPAALLLHGQPVAGGRVVRMCPGDALHVPSYWWHGAYADVGNLTLTLAFSFPRPERHVAAHARQAGCSQCDMALRPEAGGEAVPELRLEPSRIAPPPPLKPEL